MAALALAVPTPLLTFAKLKFGHTVDQRASSLPRFSVTRFGKILKVFSTFCGKFAKKCYLLWQILAIINGQISKIDLPIWSHCCPSLMQIKLSFKIRLHLRLSTLHVCKHFCNISAKRENCNGKQCNTITVSGDYIIKHFVVTCKQCDQIGQFIGLWATF